MTHRTRSGHISHTPYPDWARLLLTYCGIALALTFAACVLIAF
jgi:hypothetical protein